MSPINNIQNKLQNFIKTFYFNELIKGLLLFFSIGLLYFIFTLFVEYIFWLEPVYRSLLFWIFIAVEFLLLTKYIVIPFFKLMGLQKGISEKEASSIIGNHFPEVEDKLLNMLQLCDIDRNSELIEASIEQRSKELLPVPFKKAVDFSKNRKYIKYLIIPVFIWILVYITGNISIFNDSLTRVVHYNTPYSPPAPFSFHVSNESFDVIEGESFRLELEITGNVLPADVKIHFGRESYYVENRGLGRFEFVFSKVIEPLDFYLEANGIESERFRLNCIATPVINNLKMRLEYPLYTEKKNGLVENTGNAIVPQGTKISWHIETHQAKSLRFKKKDQSPVDFVQIEENIFGYESKFFKSFNYVISTSNELLENYEKLNFSIQVIPDEAPKIIVKSDMDSISRGPAQFIGQISDDYGLKKFQLIYYDKNEIKTAKMLEIDFQKSTFSDFYYVFPEGIELIEGVNYEMYFEVFDNDAVNGSKKAVSRKFSYYNKTSEELNEEYLKDQKDNLNQLTKVLDKTDKSIKELEKIKNAIQNKQGTDWNDTKKIEEFINRQAQYEEMIQRQTDQLEKNLLEQTVKEALKETKEELQKRIAETKEMAEEKKLLDELQKLKEKLDKEGMLNKLEKIEKKNRRNQRTLERMLELTKRFYVEQKLTQIKDNLEKLAEEQEQLSKNNTEGNTEEKQEELNEKFEKVKEELKELDSQNKDLKRPMKLPDDSKNIEEIDSEQENALEELGKQEQDKAKKSQKSAARKMKEMSSNMAMSMSAMSGEQIDENIEDLRRIVENLIEFSFQQEDLLDKFSEINNDHAEYPKSIKQQQVLKKYFEHIDDSLYVLSMRLVKMSGKIEKEVSDVHYHLDQSLSNFTENRFDLGISNEQFVITGANNLANMLGDLLDAMMNASMSLGKGKGGEGQEFSLPDIIEKLGEMKGKVEKGMKPGEKEGEKGKEGKQGEEGEQGSERMNGEIYEIYKQQVLLKEALKKALGEENGKGKNDKNGSGNAIKKMEELEKELLEKGFSSNLIQKIKRLQYELLKLEEAKMEQGEDTERRSSSNQKDYDKRAIDKLEFKNKYFNQNEILNRQSLPLRKIYKKKVQEYFKSEQLE